MKGRTGPLLDLFDGIDFGLALASQRHDPAGGVTSEIRELKRCSSFVRASRFEFERLKTAREEFRLSMGPCY